MERFIFLEDYAMYNNDCGFLYRITEALIFQNLPILRRDLSV